MDARKFIIVSLILIALQAVFLNFLDLSQLITVIFIPAIILCLPTSMNPVATVVIAFVAGLGVDILSSGLLGLCACALMPVALLRRLIITLVCGEEVISRLENISIRRQGVFKVGVALWFCCLLFFVIYVLVDSAGTRPLWFNASKIAISSILSTLIGLICVNTLTDRER